MLSIMLVDDDARLRGLMAQVFQHAGYLVHQAENGYHAIDLLQICAPDLFIVDVMMPGMDGIEFCRHIRSSPSKGHLPVLILSAQTDKASISRGMEAGATAYLCKPIPAQELLDRVQSILAATSAPPPVSDSASVRPAGYCPPG